MPALRQNRNPTIELVLAPDSLVRDSIEKEAVRPGLCSL
jgi:hypothetical protein